MAYKFTKTIDENNKFDNTNVTIEIPHNEVTLSELAEIFTEFVKACGFHPSGQLEWIEEHEVIMNKAEQVLYSKENTKGPKDE